LSLADYLTMLQKKSKSRSSERCGRAKCPGGGFFNRVGGQGILD
jgi:hypothetical protein